MADSDFSGSSLNTLYIYGNDGKVKASFTKSKPSGTLDGTGLTGTVSSGGDHWIVNITGGMLYGSIWTKWGVEINISGTQVGLSNSANGKTAVYGGGGVRICGPGMLHIDQYADRPAIDGGGGNVALTLGAVVGVNCLNDNQAIEGTGVRILSSAFHVGSSEGMGIYCWGGGLSIDESIVSVTSAKAAVYIRSKGAFTSTMSSVHLTSATESAIQSGSDVLSGGSSISVVNSVFCALGRKHGIQCTLSGSAMPVVFNNVVGVIAGNDCGIYNSASIEVSGGSTKLSIAGNISGEHSGELSGADVLAGDTSSGQAIQMHSPRETLYYQESGAVKLFSPGTVALVSATNIVAGGSLAIDHKPSYDDLQTLFTWQGAISAAEIVIGRNLFTSDAIYSDFDIAQSFSAILPSSAVLFATDSEKASTGIRSDVTYVAGGKVSVKAAGTGILVGGRNSNFGFLRVTGGKVSVDSDMVGVADRNAVGGGAPSATDSDYYIELNGGLLSAKGKLDGILTCGGIWMDGGTLEAAATGGYAGGTISSAPGLRGYALSANNGLYIDGGSFLATSGTLRTTPCTFSDHGFAAVHPCDLDVSDADSGSSVSITDMVPSWYGVDGLYPVNGKLRLWLPVGAASLKWNGMSYKAGDSGNVVAGNNVFKAAGTTGKTLSSISVSGPASVASGASATYTCTATYSDGSTAIVTPVWSLSSGASYGSIDTAGSLAVNASATGGAVTVRADYGGKTATMTVEISNAGNSAPVFERVVPEADSLSMKTGETQVFSISVFDPDGDPLSIQWGWVDIDTGNYGLCGDDTECSFVPDAEGHYSVEVYVYDGHDYAYKGWSVTVVRKGADWYVDKATGNDSNDGRGWSTAKRDIQAAIDAASSGDRIFVADGTYAPIHTVGKWLSIESVNGADKTVINAGFSRDQIDNWNGRDDVEGRCATLASEDDVDVFPALVAKFETSTTLKGFTLRNGFQTGDGGGAFGGKLVDCVLKNNGCTGYGGGAYQSILVNCDVSDNVSYVCGGGAWGGIEFRCRISGNKAGRQNSTSATGGGGLAYGFAVNCTISGNSFVGPTYGGGGCYETDLFDCVVDGNSASYGAAMEGGSAWRCDIRGNSGVYDIISPGLVSPTLFNCLVRNNTASHSSSASYPVSEIYASGGDVFNCTFYGNVAESIAGSGGKFQNCIVWGNSCSKKVFGTYANGIHNNCIQDNSHSGASNSSGNFTANPLFANTTAGDFRLSASSPCIDSGNNLFTETGANYTTFSDFRRGNESGTLPAAFQYYDLLYGLVDFDGNPRISGETVDIGAFEFGASEKTYVALNHQGGFPPDDYPYSATIESGKQVDIAPGWADSRMEGVYCVNAKIGEAMPVISIPVRENCVFQGYWTEKNGGGTQYYTATGKSARNWDKTSATTLFAKWTDIPATTYTITFKPGSYGTGSQQTDTKTKDVALQLKGAIFTRTGYTQTGWSSNDGGAKAYNLSASYTANADATLYPFWTANTYTITFDRQSGSGGTTSVMATYGQAMPAIAVPMRTGYTFGGYYTSTDGSGTQYYTSSGASARSWDKTSATTLYAKWTEVPATTYTITYKPGSKGTGSQQTDTKTKDVALTLKGAIFTRTGYTHTGWATSDGGAKAYNLSASYTANAAATLYPFWTAKPFTVTLDRQGGTGGTASVTATYGSAMPRITVPTRTGYTFGGYFTAANGGGTQYYTATGSSARKWNRASATTLYAYWTETVPSSVHRFYSKAYKGHFFTIDEAEKDNLIATNPNWKYEGEAYRAFMEEAPGTTALYRFYSKGYRGHFFTIDADEAESVKGNPNWKYEGIAYYVYPSEIEGSVPVFRFWSKGYRHHFYTTDEAEKDDLDAHNPNWKFEGVAFYALPAEESKAKFAMHNAQCTMHEAEGAMQHAEPDAPGFALETEDGERIATPGVAKVGNVLLETRGEAPDAAELASHAESAAFKSHAESAENAESSSHAESAEVTEALPFRLALPAGVWSASLWSAAEGMLNEEEADGAFDFALPANGVWHWLRVRDTEGDGDPLGVFSLWLRAK